MDARKSGSSVTASACRSPDGEKDAPNVGKNQRQAPSILGFSPRFEAFDSKKSDFLP
jgi:hypothetical protein